MFLLITFIAITNFALGYALAVYMGWAKWPNLPRRNKAAANVAPHAATSHAAAPKHAGHH